MAHAVLEKYAIVYTSSPTAAVKNIAGRDIDDAYRAQIEQPSA